MLSPEGRCLLEPPRLPSLLCHVNHFHGFMKAISGERRKRCREWSRRKVVLKDIMLGRSCEAPEFHMPQLNFDFSPSPPSLPKPQIGSCHGSTTVSGCHGGGQRPGVMRSDRVLVGNPAQLGHWNSGTELLCHLLLVVVFLERGRTFTT